MLEKKIVIKVWIDMYYGYFMIDIKILNKKCFFTVYLIYYIFLRVSICLNFKVISLSFLCREVISLVLNCKENLII